MVDETIQVSLIVPTINEALNIPLLVPRVAAALQGRSWEIIIVDDDSKDATGDVCAKLACDYPLRLIVRRPPKNGLSGAVLEGMAQARGEYFVVMDADLQHPPEKIPDLLAPLEIHSADFTLGSRYIAGGETAAGWTFFRDLNSRVATFLSRPFTGKVTDPMSGFFALRRQSYQSAQRLTPLGYKIAMELMCKCRIKNLKEIPIHFGLREHGQSKLSLKQQFHYLEHLSRLYDFTFPRASPAIKFLIATASAWLVGFAVYIFLLHFKVQPLYAPIIAYPAAIFVTALFHLRYVRTQREFLPRETPWRDFWIISMAEWAACAISATWLVQRVVPISAMELFLLTFSAATILRYILRKEFLQDIRGLRQEIRKDEVL